MPYSKKKAKKRSVELPHLTTSFAVSPEKDLWAAVLKQAKIDLNDKDEVISIEAREWVFTATSKEFNSFENICGSLGLCAERVRKAMFAGMEARCSAD